MCAKLLPHTQNPSRWVFKNYEYVCAQWMMRSGSSWSNSLLQTTASASHSATMIPSIYYTIWSRMKIQKIIVKPTLECLICLHFVTSLKISLNRKLFSRVIAQAQYIMKLYSSLRRIKGQTKSINQRAAKMQDTQR